MKIDDSLLVASSELVFSYIGIFIRTNQ